MNASDETIRAEGCTCGEGEGKGCDCGGDGCRCGGARSGAADVRIEQRPAVLPGRA